MSYAIVIQGPMKRNMPSLFSLGMYEKRFDEIIVSCYEGDDVHEDWRKHKVIMNPRWVPKIPQNNRRNVYYQCKTTLSGTMACKSEYVMKARSDECFYDLKPMMDAQMDNPNKLIYAGKEHDKRIHDHLFSVKRTNLMAAMTWVESKLDSASAELSPGRKIIKPLSPEHMFTISFLCTLNHQYLTWKRARRREFYANNTAAFQTDSLSPLIWSENGKYKHWGIDFV